MITFACSECGSTLRTAEQLAGKKARCPRCSGLTLIPPAPASEEKTCVAAGVSAKPSTHLGEVPTLAPGEPPQKSTTNTVSYVPGTAPALPARSGMPVSIPGYEVLQELGRGGMGVIYKAQQLQPRRLVALKMILAGEHASAEHLARFRTEAEAVARLQHPNIVQIHEVGEHGGHPFLTLEFVEGGSLSCYLKENKLKPRDAAELVQNLARAVHYAHKRGIIHRDLKPANILLGQATEDNGGFPWLPKIADFGLAKQLEGVSSIGPSGPMTQSGAILGTPQYMAPEQVKGKSKEIGPAADVYALGAILYELLTDKPPIQGQETLDILMKVATEEPIPPRKLRPKLPRDLETICLKCLRKEPAKRYASAQELAEDLRAFLDGDPIKARPHGTVERVGNLLKRRKEWVFLFGGGIAVLFLTALVLAFWNPFRNSAPNHTDNTTNPTEKLPPDLQMIPRDMLGFASFRIADLWTLNNPFDLARQTGLNDEKTLNEAKKILDQLERELSLKPQDLERLTFVLPNLDSFIGVNPNLEEVDGPVIIFAFNKPYDWDKVKKFTSSFLTYHEKKRGIWPIWEPLGNDRFIAINGLYRKSETILLLGRGVDLAKFLERSEKVNEAGPLQDALALAAKKHHFVMGIYPPVKDLDFIQKSTKNPIASAFLELRGITFRTDVLPPAKVEDPITGFDAELRLVFPNGAKADQGMSAAKDLLSDVIKYYDQSPLAKETPPLVNKLLLPLRQADWKLEGKSVRLAVKAEWQAKEIENLVQELDIKFATRTLAKNQLKQMGIGMHAYNDTYKRLPPAAITDKLTGKPLLSWRVALLPFLEQTDLYKKFKLDLPWDHPDNLPLLNKMPDVYKAPRPKNWKRSSEDNTHTFYQVFVGPNTLFDPKQITKIQNIPDGTVNTLLIVEAAKPVPWTKPEDLSYDPKGPLPALGGPFPDGFHGLTADGAPHFFPKTFTEPKLRPFITYNDGIPVQLP